MGRAIRYIMRVSHADDSSESESMPVEEIACRRRSRPGCPSASASCAPPRKTLAGKLHRRVAQASARCPNLVRRRVPLIAVAGERPDAGARLLAFTTRHTLLFLMQLIEQTEDFNTGLFSAQNCAISLSYCGVSVLNFQC